MRRKLRLVSVEDYASSAIRVLIRLSFSKTQEDEADEYGFRLLVNQGYDPIAMSTAFEKLLKARSKQASSNLSFEPNILSINILDLIYF